ncbi:triose-phosphate isomerase [Aliishimia ponticola]|uniref:Triosephosphate isomerase n=1 Tax=Aliishimia ponticola TaxID=2499833 RepID=A0A4S4NGR3_9RHOB|nr:triose-phosphate isomerase [Aliishimia ponticola]THH38819.1 triose-phosphate isomerase [Aliishimia ponticola]
MRRKLAAGNWKMNGLAASLKELAALAQAITADDQTGILICPPAPLLYRASEAAKGTGISIGAQDCHGDADGAYTGDISAAMIADTGATHVIVGHSERREAHHEDDAEVRGKARAAHACDLTAIICIGETEAEREAGNTLDILAGQLAGSCPDNATAANTVIAYEPIWAIGTGRVPTLEQIVEVHDHLRAKLIARFGDEGHAMRLLYGGSVKPDNAATIFKADNVDGALVGGASLKATDFAPIITALQAS